MSIFNRLRMHLAMIWANITLEPALFVIGFATRLDDIPLNELLIYKVCINKFNFSEHICENLLEDEFLEYNQEVQHEFTKYNIVLQVLQSALPTFAALYLGAWCDLFGRKFLMGAYWAAQLMNSVQLQVNAYWKNGPPELYLLHVIPTSLIGGWAAFTVARNAFISDITPPEKRAFRLAMQYFALTLGRPLGTYLGAFIFEQFGIVACLTTSLVVQIIGVLIVMWKIRGYKYTPPIAKKATCTSIFSPSLVKDSFKTAFKKRPGNARFLIFFLLIGCFFLYAPGTGERVISYVLFRDRFQWGPQDIATYAAVIEIWSIIVQALINPLMKKLKLNEITLLMVLISMRVVSDVLIFFANKPWLMYLARMVDVASLYGYFIIGSLFTCVAPVEELGRVNAIFSISDNLNPIIIGPLYRELYHLTEENMLGAPYLVSAAAGLIFVFMMVYLQCLFKGKHISEVTGYTGNDFSKPATQEESAENETNLTPEEKFDTINRMTLSWGDSVRLKAVQTTNVINAI